MMLDPTTDDDLEYVCACGHGVCTHIDHGPCEGLPTCACRAFVAVGIRDNSLFGLTVEDLPYEDADVPLGVRR